MTITQVLTYRPAAPDDDPQLVGIENRIFPEWPPLTLEEYRYRHDRTNLPADAVVERSVAVRDGRVIGAVELSTAIWTDQPNRYNGTILVHPDHCGRGIGSRLYEALERRAHELKASHVYGYVREDLPEAQEFLKHRGFVTTGHSDRASRLDVRQAHLEGREALEADVHRQGIRIATLAEMGVTEAFLRALYDLESATAKDVPASEPVAMFQFELWRRVVLTAPGRSPEAVWVALDGDRPVAAAYLQRHGETAAENGYTCTHPDYRGRGLARVLKLRTVLWARENGIEYIYTDNDIDNKRMLDINVRLGYKPMPCSLEVVKHVAEARSL